MRNVFAAFVIVLMASFVSAREIREADPIPMVHVSEYAGHRMTAGAPTDTFQVLGGPGTLDGKFEDAAGLPDAQDWYGVDLTQTPEARWDVRTGQAQNLDPDNPGNLAWTCQELFPPCSPTDPPEGYGPGWNEMIAWSGTVDDPNQDVTVRVRARLNHDVEPPEDYFFLEHRGPESWTYHIMWTGTRTGASFDESFVVPATDFQGENSDEVRLRWRVMSDGAWDDADCLWPTRGAAQIDSIIVTFDQGQGEQMIGWVETCEPGVPLQWTSWIENGVGDYAQVWPQLDDLDDTTENDTPRLAFIDDGEVEPESPGTPCVSWCYGPDGWIVVNDEGLSVNDRLDNQFWSPPIAVPAAGIDGALLAFDLYLHTGNIPGAPYIYPTWGLRSTADPTGEDGWSEWTETPIALWGGPETVRIVENISHGLVDDPAFVQLALGLRDIADFDGSDGTPAPYYDNVSLKLFTRQGGAVVTVAPDGTGDVPTIQSAVLVAAPGDTIELAAGTYTGPGNRDVDLLGKTLVIRSADDDPATCILDLLADAEGDHRGFTCDGDTGLDTVIRGLTVRGGRQVRMGAAVYVRQGGGVTLENCVFEDNQVLDNYRHGGAVHVDESQAVIRDCVFRDNHADYGAAVAALDASQVTLEGCLIVDNRAGREGSGLYVTGVGTQAAVTGCTLVGNREQLNHGVVHVRTYAHVDMERTIVADTELGTAVWCNLGTVSIACSNFHNNHAGDWVNCAAEFEGLDGNISADPLFCGDAAPDQPYGIDALSPCAPEQNDCGLMGAYGVACDQTTGVDDAPAPSELMLAAGMPNPANPATVIRYSLPDDGPVRLQLHDLRGRLVRRLVNADLPAGDHSVRWDGHDDAGRAMASGVYVVRLEAAGRAIAGRLTLVR